MTKTEIDALYKSQHDTLSDAFYAKKRTEGVSQQEQDDFNTSHASIMFNWNQAYIDNGVIEPPRDFKGMFANAGSVAEKMNIIAEMLGLGA